MKGMIFAAGIGSRLKPWTDSHPKAMVPVGGRPVLGIVIERLLRAGVDGIVVNVHHFADQIEDFLAHDFSGCPITVSDERDRLLDTGGGLRKALPLLGDEPVLVHNADIVSDIDLRRMMETHAASDADASLLVQERRSSRHFLFDGSGRLRGWHNSNTGALRPASLASAANMHELAFGGVHVISPSVYPALMAYAPAGVPFSITDFYIDSCGAMTFHGYVLPAGGLWFDVGRPDTLEAARAHFSMLSNG